MENTSFHFRKLEGQIDLIASNCFSVRFSLKREHPHPVAKHLDAFWMQLHIEEGTIYGKKHTDQRGSERILADSETGSDDDNFFP